MIRSDFAQSLSTSKYYEYVRSAMWLFGRNNVKWRLAVNFSWRTYVCMFVWSQKLIGINES